MLSTLKTKFPDVTIKRTNTGFVLSAHNKYNLLNFLITHPEVQKINIMRTFIEIELGTKTKEISAHNKPIHDFNELKKYL